VSSKGRVIRSEEGRAEKMIGVNIDITDRKLAEESLMSALAEVQQLKDRLHEENIYLKEEVRGAQNYGEIVGRSEALKRVLSQTEQVAPLNTTVLILGETGTGKELLAHAIHTHSPRAKNPLVKVNCAALPAPLIETELFGHAKGAFTGASGERRGRFEIADGSTLFLDEVASFHSICNRSCCVFWRKESSNALAAVVQSQSTFA
jgi:transcriptional regulator with GAF, ATPase, and Fis domain